MADPTKKETAEVLRLVESFISHTFPLRFGLVFAVNSDKKVTGYDDAGVAILCAFNYVIQGFDDREDANAKGLQFLIEVG